MARLTLRHPIVRLLALLALLSAAAVALRLSPLAPYFTRQGIGEAVVALRGSSWAPVVYVVVYIGATALALPGSVLTLAGGALFGVLWGTVFTTIGANVGANIAFLVARGMGRDGIRRLAGHRLAGLDRAALEHGFLGLLVLRLIPLVPFNALNFGSGLTALPWRSYALATAVGILPGTVVYTFFADALLQGSQEASREAFLRVAIAGGLLIVLSLVPMLVKKMRVKLPGAAVLAALWLAPPPAAGAQTLPDHDRFTQVLQHVVVGDRVDYERLMATRLGLDEYLASLARVSPRSLDAADRQARLAFWINAYNGCMLRLVIDHYPIKKARFPRSLVNAIADRPANSVWQIAGVFTKEFCRVALEDRSLDEIEHQILRPMGDPRIHFAINCAARSCPPLAAEAYVPAGLNEQLDRQVQSYIAGSPHFRIERGATPRVVVHKVLDWFGDDFGGEQGIRTFLARYLSPGDAALVRDPATDLVYDEYDWTLNDIDR